MKHRNLYLLAPLCLFYSVCPAADSVPTPSVPSTPPQLAAALQPLVDSHSLAGAVLLVASKDKVLDLEAVGYEDIAANKPMKTDSLFWIASMSKAITAAGLMILVDEGKVKLDDPVEKYLPEFKGQMVIVEKDENHILLKKPVHSMTVRNVLSHTSGMTFSSQIEHPTLDIFPLETRVRSYAMMPLQYEPDTKWQYSNAGINIAGRIIEVASGQSYAAFLDEHLFKPLGMKDTTFWPNEEQISRLAKSYKANKDKSGLEETQIGQLLYPLNDHSRQPMPAGGLFSTATDIAIFCQLLLNEGEFNGKRYLSEAAVKEMTKRQTAEGLASYGFGLAVDTNQGSYGHGGAYSTDMQVDPKHGLIKVFMVQNAGWLEEGKKAQPAFNKAVQEAFIK